MRRISKPVQSADEQAAEVRKAHKGKPKAQVDAAVEAALTARAEHEATVQSAYDNKPPVRPYTAPEVA